MSKIITDSGQCGQAVRQPLILAVETSAPTGSVAIAIGERILDQTGFSGPMRHSAEIFIAISRLLGRFDKEPQQIEHIYISIGPGSFTGLRIAATLAKIMHLADDVKIVAVDTLDVIAANAAASHEKVAVIVDAKRGQFFIAAYQRNTQYSAGHLTVEKILPDCLMSASQFLDNFAGKAEPVWLLGPGLINHRDKFQAEGIKFLDEKYWNPQAEKVHLLGWPMALAEQFADALTLTPTYLRLAVT